jgi:acyl-CoA synthetase (AMP-forming)/AMP-acid ligase II/thioesterase domain-containing protein/acyl carrier protein
VDLKNLQWLDESPLPLDWKGPRVRPFDEFRAEALDRSIIGNLRHIVARHAERVAVFDRHSSLSFGELWEGMGGLAQLVAAKTERGELIAVLLPASSLYPLAMLACLAAGRPFAAVDMGQPSDWIVQTLETLRPALIIGTRESRELAGIGAPAAPFVDVTSLPWTSRRWQPAPLGPDEPACVLLTSGSTGRPKAVVNSQRALQQRVAQSINAAHINAEDRLLTLAPVSSIVGVRDVFTSLLAGASIHFLDAQRAAPREVLSLIGSQAITILFAAPALLRSIGRDARERAGPTLRLVRVGGDTTLWSDIDLLRSWLAPQAAIQSIYAATEAPMMQWFVEDACRGEDPRVPIGYPLPGNALAVVDESGHAAARGEVGELIVRSPYVSLGSWSEGRTVADALGSGHGSPARRVFRTGDLVRVRPDGLLERLGRKDRQAKIRGVRVELEGVECAVRRHPLVRDVAVLVRTTDDGGTRLVAYVCARDDASEALLDELRESLRSAPQAMRPALWYRLDAIPRLPNFKLDLRALQALDARTARDERCAPERAARAPALRSDCIEPTVARIWQEVLQAPVADREQDFFQSGGDSLKAIRFVSELERALGIELPVTLINEAPDFGKLCAMLRERRTSRYVPLVLLKEGDGAPPLYFVHGLGGNVAELFPLARSMIYPGAVFGIQARGLRAQERPHLTVEAMAVEYLREIKTRQPRGPYCLCGYSFGGLVALEMAQRLLQSGDRVAFLGLFDTMPSSLVWPPRTWLGCARRRLAHMLSTPMHTWPGATWSAGARMLTRLRDHLAQRQPGGLPVPAFLASAPASVLKVGISALVASSRYRPRFYAGALTLFTPTSRDPSLPSLQVIWRRHALALSVVPTVGAHLTMFSAANAAAAAASLSRALMLPAGSRPATQTPNVPSPSLIMA